MKRGIGPRLVLLAASTLGLCMCVSTQRTPRTVVGIGGGYSDTVNNDYGCGGGPVGSQRHHIRLASIYAERETAGLLSYGATANAASGSVVETAGDNAGIGRPQWKATSALAWLGVGGSMVGGELGAGFLSNGYLSPYASLRVGNPLSMWGEARFLSREPLIEPDVLTVHVHLREDRTRLSVGTGLFGRRMSLFRRTAVPPAYGVPTEVTSLGSRYADLDLGLDLQAEWWLNRDLGFRVSGLAAQNWYVAGWLVLALPE